MSSKRTRHGNDQRPPHHLPGTGFTNPWPTAHFGGRGSVLQWWWERRTRVLPPDPAPGALPVAQSVIAHPHAPPDEIRATWVGHASFLLQVGGRNLLVDPHWSNRASPLRWAGPRRFLPPGVPFEGLPPIHAVLLSHDHYDHLDEPTVRRLVARFGERLRWFTPLGYGRWLAKRGARATEMDWWEEAEMDGLQIHCLPAQHWSSRAPWDRFRRLWCSWAVTTHAGRSVFFAGDSGWFPGYADIRRRVGDLDLALLPIGAYEPRWFMQPSHMNPEEAVQAYRELGGQGIFCGMHWGTFRLTDEDPLEPPARTRSAWVAAGLPPERLWIPSHGETRVIDRR